MRLAERDRELAVLAEVLDDSSRGRGSVALVQAGAGCGRTELLDALGRAAAERGFLVLRAGGSAPERHVQGGVLRQLLAYSEVPVGLGPDRSRVFGAGAAARVGAAARWPPDAGTAGTLHELSAGLLRISERMPVLLCVDDIEFADPLSLHWILHLVRSMRSARIAVVAAECTPSGPDRAQLRTELLRQPGHRRIVLEPLSPSAVATVLTGHLGERTAAALAESWHRISGGNPLLLRALVEDRRSAAPQGRAPYEPEPVVAGAYADAVLSCLHRAGPLALRLARVLAVLDGAETDSGLAARLLDEESGAVEECRGALEAAGLLDGGRLRHPVARSAVLRGLSASARRELHGRAAELLHQGGAQALRIAPHLLAAGREHPSWAVPVLEEASERHLEDDRPQDAHDCLDLALALALAASRDEDERVALRARLAALAWVLDPALGARHMGELARALREGRLPGRYALALARRLLWHGRFEEAAEAVEAAGRTPAPDPATATDLRATRGLLSTARGPAPPGPGRADPGPAGTLPSGTPADTASVGVASRAVAAVAAWAGAHAEEAVPPGGAAGTAPVGVAAAMPDGVAAESGPAAVPGGVGSGGVPGGAVPAGTAPAGALSSGVAPGAVRARLVAADGVVDGVLPVGVASGGVYAPGAVAAGVLAGSLDPGVAVDSGAVRAGWVAGAAPVGVGLGVVAPGAVPAGVVAVGVAHGGLSVGVVGGAVSAGTGLAGVAPGVATAGVAPGVVPAGGLPPGVGPAGGVGVGGVGAGLGGGAGCGVLRGGGDARVRAASALADVLARGSGAAGGDDAEGALRDMRLGGETQEWIVAAVTALVLAERLEAAEGWCELRLAEARGRRVPLWEAEFTSLLAGIRLRQGDPRAARRLAEAALVLVPAEGWGARLGGPLSVLVRAATETGDHEAAARHLAVPVPDRMFSTRFGLDYLHARGRQRLEAGRPDEALDDFAVCSGLMRAWGCDRPALVPWRTESARAHLALGDEATARALAQEQLALAGPERTRTRGLTLRVLAATADVAERVALLTEAAGVLREAGDPLETAGALTDLGRAHLAEARADRARAVFEMAARLAGRCGAQPLATVVAAELERLGPRGGRTADSGTGCGAKEGGSDGGQSCGPGRAPCHGPRRAAPAPELLSEAERRVAGLAVGGYTNKEISELLVVTVSTVEQHLTRIFRKLGVKARKDLPPELGADLAESGPAVLPAYRQGGSNRAEPA
ncbi:AAA family ATPase [Streptomyces sp. NPDC058401]|uniref:AAA family ATPase n=1 Tax=Streptomyces sp. NPDC058401 TaxID=3346480 RepID=UPI00364AA79D